MGSAFDEIMRQAGKDPEKERERIKKEAHEEWEKSDLHKKAVEYDRTSQKKSEERVAKMFADNQEKYIQSEQYKKDQELILEAQTLVSKGRDIIGSSEINVKYNNIEASVILPIFEEDERKSLIINTAYDSGIKKPVIDKLNYCFRPLDVQEYEGFVFTVNDARLNEIVPYLPRVIDYYGVNNDSITSQKILSSESLQKRGRGLEDMIGNARGMINKASSEVQNLLGKQREINKGLVKQKNRIDSELEELSYESRTLQSGINDARYDARRAKRKGKVIRELLAKGEENKLKCEKRQIDYKAGSAKSDLRNLASYAWNYNISILKEVRQLNNNVYQTLEDISVYLGGFNEEKRFIDFIKNGELELSAPPERVYEPAVIAEVHDVTGNKYIIGRTLCIPPRNEIKNIYNDTRVIRDMQLSNQDYLQILSN